MSIELYKKIRSVRELRAYSQNYVAERLGVNQKAYSKMELGKTQLNWDKLNKIAAILAVSIFELVDPTRSLNEMNIDSGFEDKTVSLLKQFIDDYESQITKLKEENQSLKEENLVLNLEKNIDILSYVSNHNSARPNLVIGFAAETNDLEKNSKKKLLDKNCDWIIANNVSDSSIGFDSDYNEISIYYKNTQFKSEKISKRKKSEIADEITNRIINQLN